MAVVDRGARPQLFGGCVSRSAGCALKTLVKDKIAGETAGIEQIARRMRYEMSALPTGTPNLPLYRELDERLTQADAAIAATMARFEEITGQMVGATRA